MKIANIMKPQYRKPLVISLAAIGVITLAVIITSGSGNADKKPAASKPSLSVSIEQPQSMRMQQKITANGNITAWQEAIIGSNVSGLVLADVRVNVGDVVKRGQVLATFANQTVAADLEQAKARTAEAEATAAEAEANAERARKVGDSGALSAQQLNQYLIAAQTAKAKLNAQIAATKAQQVRLGDTNIVAPDNGIISARTATVGAVPSSPELFRLIRQGRLEWRAEIPAALLGQIKPGMVASITPATSGTSPLKGKVRVVGPTVDANTRNGIVYVDLPASPLARAGMFAAGEFDIGASDALTLPQSAVMVRDGFSYVFIVDENSKAVQTKVGIGRRSGDRIEIVTGLTKNARVISSGGGFLTDGDTVRVVDAVTPPAAAPAAPPVATPAPAPASVSAPVAATQSAPVTASPVAKN